MSISLSSTNLKTACSTSGREGGYGSYSPLHCRSRFSFLRGVLSIDDICGFAREQGAGAAGLCDVNGFYGVPEFVRKTARYGLKPLIGTEIHFGGRYLCSLYAMNREGFGRINEIITRILEHQRLEKGGKESVHIHLIRDYHPVHDLSAGGWQGVSVLSPHRDVLSALARRSTRDLYCMLQWGRPFRALIREASRLGVSIIAVNRGIFIEEGQQKYYRLLRAVDDNTTVSDSSVPPDLPSFFRLCSRDEFRDFFSAVPDAVFNAQRLVRDSAFEFTPRKFIFPSFKGMSGDREFLYLSSLCRQGIHRRYGKETTEIHKRLSYELSIIKRKGFAGYFLVVHDIVSQCPRTCGRGSSAASIVSYLLGITHVDPLSHNLFFERFLNMGRKDPPDIDVDFPWDERRKVLDYVFTTYAGQSGMVADHITFGPRSSIRDPARAFGFEESQINSIGDAYRIEGKDLPPFLEEARSWLRGIPRNLGTHPGGVVITPGSLHRYAHIQISPLGIPVIPWEKDGAEEAGLVKIDLLGNRSLGVLRDSISLVNKKLSTKGQDLIEWESFSPLDDGKTREMIEEGDTLGVFYVESPATRQLLQKMKTGDFRHLIIASSIIRPAANKYIHEYVKRLHGGKYSLPLPALGRILSETHGIMVYQEDVARVAIGVCGFSPAEADGLRKILSKKDKGAKLDEIREYFYRGAEKKGVSPSVTDELWEAVLSFEGYSFCKAHSASYALVSYRLGWLKRRYPLQFLASVINNGGGFYSRAAYLNYCRRLGFPILPPDVNRSRMEYTIEDNALRVGLCQLKGITGGCPSRIIEEREKEGGYEDLGDFLDRVGPTFDDMSVLVRSGSLDSLSPGWNRPQIFWIFFNYTRQKTLFGLPSPPQDLGDYSGENKLLHEIRTLDLLVSAHPLEMFQSSIERECLKRKLGLVNSQELGQLTGKRVTLPGSMVTGKQVLTRNKKEMCFVTFEDSRGLFETVIFPDVYRRMAPLLDRYSCFLIQGRVQKEFDVHILQLDNLIPLVRDQRIPSRRIFSEQHSGTNTACQGGV